MMAEVRGRLSTQRIDGDRLNHFKHPTRKWATDSYQPASQQEWGRALRACSQAHAGPAAPPAGGGCTWRSVSSWRAESSHSPRSAAWLASCLQRERRAVWESGLLLNETVSRFKVVAPLNICLWQCLLQSHWNGNRWAFKVENDSFIVLWLLY